MPDLSKGGVFSNFKLFPLPHSLFPILRKKFQPQFRETRDSSEQEEQFTIPAKNEGTENQSPLRILNSASKEREKLDHTAAKRVADRIQ
jgi:hypothetical protein